MSFANRPWGDGIVMGVNHIHQFVTAQHVLWDSSAQLGGIDSSSVRYTGPTATHIRPRTIWWTLEIGVYTRKGGNSILFGASRHRVGSGLALVDVTTARTLAKYDLIWWEGRCGGGFRLAVHCGGSLDLSLDGINWQIPYKSASKIIRNHRYRLAYTQNAYVGVGGGSAWTDLDVSDLQGTLGW